MWVSARGYRQRNLRFSLLNHTLYLIRCTNHQPGDLPSKLLSRREGGERARVNSAIAVFEEDKCVRP